MHIDLNHYRLWFVTGTQSLYGDETLKEVAEDSKKIVKYFSEESLPIQMIYKLVMINLV